MQILAVVKDAEKLTKDFALSKLRIYSKRDDQDDHELDKTPKLVSTGRY